MVLPRVVARRHDPHGIIRPVEMTGGGADKMLVHALDAHFAVIAVGISAGVAEDGIVEVHPVGIIKILGLPEIDDRRDANPRRFKVRAGGGCEVRDVCHRNRSIVDGVRLQPGIRDVFV